MEADKKLVEFKNFWFINKHELGDMLRYRTAYKCLTFTLNNLGLSYKM